MPRRPSYGELERRVRELEEIVADRKATDATNDARYRSVARSSVAVDANGSEGEETEEGFRSASSFLDLIIEMSPLSMWVSDAGGTVMRTNRSLRVALSVSDDDVVGRYNVLRDENLENHGVMPMVRDVFEKHVPARFSIPWKAADSGSISCLGARDRYIDVSILPIVNSEGVLTNAVCQWADITEHKKIEASVRESEEKYRSIVDNIGIGVALISPKMEILELNNQMREWFPTVDVVGKPICYRSFNIPPTSEVCDYCPTIKTLRDGKVHEDITSTKQGSLTRNYRIVSSPLVDADGNVMAAIEMVEDITEKINLQKQLVQAQRLESVGRLAGGVAHDFNNMLSIIIGYGELALSKLRSRDDLRSDIVEILDAAQRSADITRQLLAFARRQTIAPEILDLQSTIEKTLKMLRRLIGEDVNLVWEPGPDVWPVRIDPVQVDQILANLCVNARDAIADVGEIVISTENMRFDTGDGVLPEDASAGDFVKLTVTDNGVGIESEDLDKIFEPFFTTKTIGKGTGLGLATVYGIVKQNQGFIKASSEIGEGTTLEVFLPRYDGVAADLAAVEPVEPPRGRMETILLVEDDESILRLIASMLEDLGYSVHATTSPTEAISAADEYGDEIDLVLTDIVMPTMNGLEMFEQLYAKHPGLGVVFMSGYPAHAIADRGLDANDVAVLTKPFSMREMAVRIRERLDARE